MLPQDTMHVTQRPCNQQGSMCQDPAGNQTTWRPSDHHKEMQTAVAWICLPFIRSGQNHLQGTAKGGRQGRHQKRWEDSIREWTACSSPSPIGQWRTEKNGRNWFCSLHAEGQVRWWWGRGESLWCPWPGESVMPSTRWKSVMISTRWESVTQYSNTLY